MEKKRRFKVWVGCNHTELHEEVLEFDPDISEKDITVAIMECIDTLISNEFDTGWEELDE